MKDWARVERYLKRIAETDGITEDHLWSLRGQGGPESTATPAMPMRRSKLTEEAIDSWSRFRKGQPVTEDDKFRLEAIVLPNGLRPAFDIKDDTFSDLSEPWGLLNSHRSFLNSCIRGIGRVNVPGHARLQYAGTGFIVGDKLLLTNRHVAEEFCQTHAAELVFTPGISPNLDMKQEVADSVSVIVKVSKPVLILSDWDAALFRIDAMPAMVTPLQLAGASPGDVTGRLATIIGYPALITTVTTEEILQQIQIFRDIFDKKRMQPGRLIGLRERVSFGRNVNALAHDCSTLGGNSGSALIDIESEKIIGVHFGGDYLVANYAVPSWELAEHRNLRDQGVLFS